ncbi:hypothetical protein SARC_08798 [Sphaeroforma arctica JP610]|uniref:Uncharacterized protein n=1 Tax=Sphaeroforma arctica JP610 TaxID=667725 RepID=A0A0L0FS34_9EUKA|nr:hypothetical protein SARC_08798 [Sphaeroforma arctica JP610]KNC78783.1 hypothetical protein SARC_08798 [Sphaeroforma arctica JP610]|eukprot:XP_014152685.1 hypothetical protein SARC_08798 [Sphaeroforma arctica JP610]
MASSFTLLGSLGKNIFGAEDKIVDIQKAEYEMGIGCKPLAVDVDIVNKQYMEYEAWLLALFDKYLDHLSTNGNDYPMIKERFSTVVDKERQLRMALQDLAYEPSKVERDADGSAKEQGNYTFFKTKAFWPVRDGSRIPSTDPPKKSFGVDTLIEYVYDSKPSMVTLFDIQGKPIPRTEWDVREDDIVSIKATLDAGLFKVNDPKEEDLSGNKKLVIYMGKRLHSVVLAEEGGNEEERVPLDVLNDMLLDLIGWAKSSVTEERWEKAYQDYLHRLQGRRLEAMNRKKSAKAMTKETDSLYAKPKNSLYGYKRR